MVPPIPKTFAALADAILTLSQAGHVDRLSVSDVATAAGIHRVTFYDHARSPAELLARVIRDELDIVRAQYLQSPYLSSHTMAEAIRHTSRDVAAVVAAHREIFEHLMAEPSRTTVHHLLAPHFEQSVTELLAGGNWTVPTEVIDPDLTRAEFEAGVARYVANGCVGVIEAWLQAATTAGSGAPDPQRYVSMVEPLLPRWLFAPTKRPDFPQDSDRKKNGPLATAHRVSVRPVEQQDAAPWAELYRAYRAFYRLAPDDAVIERVWGWILNPAHEVTALVAVIDGRVVGLAHYRHFSRPSSGTTGLFLDDLFAETEVRGKGAGRALLNELSRLSAQDGGSVVRWITAADNTTARRLYDSTATATAWVTYDLTPGSL